MNKTKINPTKKFKKWIAISGASSVIAGAGAGVAAGYVIWNKPAVVNYHITDLSQTSLQVGQKVDITITKNGEKLSSLPSGWTLKTSTPTFISITEKSDGGAVSTLTFTNAINLEENEIEARISLVDKNDNEKWIHRRFPWFNWSRISIWDKSSY
ncbi:MAG: hypothetical protein LBM76_02300 [Mycoplasmataceae bacterium]|nr:hypothetical protein [Mycoplasmataceae bacterium]